jgi:hypothetical protein
MSKPIAERTHKKQIEARHMPETKRTTTHPKRQARRERAYARGAPRPEIKDN